jgi:hypothetical protein
VLLASATLGPLQLALWLRRSRKREGRRAILRKNEKKKRRREGGERSVR